MRKEWTSQNVIYLDGSEGMTEHHFDHPSGTVPKHLVKRESPQERAWQAHVPYESTPVPNDIDWVTASQDYG